MEGIAQFLSSLTGNERFTVVATIANAFIIFLICFVGIDGFKTYQWYHQAIWAFSLSICYTVTFYLILISIIGGLCVFKRYRDFCFMVVKSNFKWVICIFSLGNSATLTEIIRTLVDETHSFCFRNIEFGAFSVIIGVSLLFLFSPLFYKK